MWLRFRCIIDQLVEKHVKVQSKKVTRSEAWYNKALERFSNVKIDAWRKYRENKSQENWERYKIARNGYTNEIRKSKIEFEKKIAN